MGWYMHNRPNEHWTDEAIKVFGGYNIRDWPQPSQADRFPPGTADVRELTRCVQARWD